MVLLRVTVTLVAVLLLDAVVPTIATCPSVSINQAIWVDGYHSENVLFSDANDNCAVKCSSGWLWLSDHWPDFVSYNSAQYVGDKGDGVYYSAEDMQSKNITCTSPPPSCGTACRSSLIAPCDQSAFICKQATPKVTTTGGCTQVTCPDGTNLVSTSFEDWRIGDFAQCGGDGVWYSMTGWLLNDTSVTITCAVEKGGNQCVQPQATNNCPTGSKCNGNAVQMQPNAAGTLVISCTEGTLYASNAPSWKPAAGDVLTCGESGKWFRPDGVALSGGAPTLTCITGQSTGLNVLPQDPVLVQPIAPVARGAYFLVETATTLIFIGFINTNYSSYALSKGCAFGDYEAMLGWKFRLAQLDTRQKIDRITEAKKKSPQAVLNMLHLGGYKGNSEPQAKRCKNDRAAVQQRKSTFLWSKNLRVDPSLFCSLEPDNCDRQGGIVDETQLGIGFPSNGPACFYDVTAHDGQRFPLCEFYKNENEDWTKLPTVKIGSL